MVNRAVRAVAAIVAVGVLASAAFAKAPPEQPTIESIFEKAQHAIKEKSELPPDPVLAQKAQIDDYRDPKKTPLAQFAPLAECMRNWKDDRFQANRQPAAQALVERFGKEPDTPEVKNLKCAAALAVLDLMKADPKDETGLRIIEFVLKKWWPAKTQMDLKFNWNDKPAARASAWKKMKTYLEKGGN